MLDVGAALAGADGVDKGDLLKVAVRLRDDDLPAIVDALGAGGMGVQFKK